MKTKNIALGFGALVLLLLVMGLFSGGGHGISNPHSVERDPIGGTPQPAPNFALESLDGSTLALSDYKGVKPVVLDFWASWCPNCRRDMPRLERFYQKYKDQVEVIGINLHEDEGVVRKFAESRNITFPIVLDPNSIAARSYAVRYTNFHVLIDINGDVVGTVPGDISESDILALINLSS